MTCAININSCTNECVSSVSAINPMSTYLQFDSHVWIMIHAAKHWRKYDCLNISSQVIRHTRDEVSRALIVILVEWMNFRCRLYSHLFKHTYCKVFVTACRWSLRSRSSKVYFINQGNLKLHITRKNSNCGSVWLTGEWAELHCTCVQWSDHDSLLMTCNPITEIT